jgi:hypothetical protein
MPDDENTRSQPNPTPEASIRAALQAIADGIADGSKLTVSTSVQVLDTSSTIQVAREKIEVARTEISIDGDRDEVVPVMINAGSLEVPQAIQALHEQHVAEALAYRKQLLDTLVDFVKTRRLG